MYDMFKNFGTALYLRRGMQKRAFYAKKAVDYLEKVGALDPQAQPEYEPQYEQQPYPQQQMPMPQRRGGLSMGEAAGLGIGAGAVGALGATGAYRFARRGLIGKAQAAENEYNRQLGAAYRSKAVQGMGNVPMEARMAKVDQILAENGAKAAREKALAQNAKRFATLRKIRNPLLGAGMLAGGAFAAKHVYDRSREPQEYGA